MENDDIYEKMMISNGILMKWRLKPRDSEEKMDVLAAIEGKCNHRMSRMSSKPNSIVGVYACASSLRMFEKTQDI